jgi:hypothetical protein
MHGATIKIKIRYRMFVTWVKSFCIPARINVYKGNDKCCCINCLKTYVLICEHTLENMLGS